VVNVKFCSVNKFFFQVVLEFVLLHILVLLLLRDFKLVLKRGQAGNPYTESRGSSRQRFTYHGVFSFLLCEGLSINVTVCYH
jgi:hypothetical protein